MTNISTSKLELHTPDKLNKLDKIDCRILFELKKNSRIPETALAKLIRRSKESVRYRIKQLTTNGYITGFTIWMDPAKLGYQSAKIYVELSNRPKRKTEFIDYVKNEERVFWLGIADGAWNAGITYFVKNNKEFFDLKNELFSKFRDLILESKTAVLVSASYGEMKFLHQSETPLQTIFENVENNTLDETEQHILKQLFKNSRTTLVDLAKICNTTIDIVRNRMRRLEAKGIISRYTINIDFKKLGMEFYKTFLYFRNITKKDEMKLFEYSRKHPNILHLMKQISPWDVELEIMCKNYSEYSDIISEITQEFSDVINKVETAIMSEDHVFPGKQLNAAISQKTEAKS